MQSLDSNKDKRNNEAYLQEIKPMTMCLNHKKCAYLDAPGKQRPCCKIVKTAIFDLDKCPLNKWWL